MLVIQDRAGQSPKRRRPVNRLYKRYAVKSELAGQLHKSGFRVQADYPQTHASRLNGNGRLFDPSRNQIGAAFVHDQFRRPTVAVGHKGDLRVKSLRKIVARSPERSHSSGRLSA
jgi:hypothetical protein